MALGYTGGKGGTRLGYIKRNGDHNGTGLMCTERNGDNNGITVVAPVGGLLLAAVCRHPIDLHSDKRVHDGAELLPVQLWQLLCCDDLGTTGEQGDTVGVPVGRDIGKAWRVARGWTWGWCHPYGMQAAAVGESHPDAQHEGVGAAAVGVEQELGFQHVTTTPVAQEAPGVQVHLIAWRLEVEGHCRDRDGAIGVDVASQGTYGAEGSPSWQPAFHISWGL